MAVEQSWSELGDTLSNATDNFSVAWYPGYAIIKINGVIELPNMVDANNVLTSDARFDDIQGFLVDMSDAEMINMSDMDLRVVAALGKAAPKYNPRKLKVAYVIRSHQIRNTIARAVDQYFHKEWDRMLFIDPHAALQWVKR